MCMANWCFSNDSEAPLYSTVYCTHSFVMNITTEVLNSSQEHCSIVSYSVSLLQPRLIWFRYLLGSTRIDLEVIASTSRRIGQDH